MEHKYINDFRYVKILGVNEGLGIKLWGLSNLFA